MLTNCRKNQEIKYVQDDIKEVHSIISEFTHKLDKISHFEEKQLMFEERVSKEQVRMRKDIKSKDEKAEKLTQDIREFRDQVRTMTHELKLKDDKFQ